eukprot:7081601-Prymnesium_polylepis.1
MATRNVIASIPAASTVNSFLYSGAAASDVSNLDCLFPPTTPPPPFPPTTPPFPPTTPPTPPLPPPTPPPPPFPPVGDEGGPIDITV